LSPELRPPIEHCHPDALELAVEKLVADKAYREDLGRRAYEFVRANYSPPIVAERYLRLIRGDIPAEWIVDPGRLRYFMGFGLTEDRCRQFLSDTLRIGGTGSLQLADKPELERLIVEFADGQTY
ncbi:unnamed protein product, partial [marine sediment metagenome]